MNELKPCPNPWCSRELAPSVMHFFRSGRCRVECGSCNTSGPSEGAEEEAITAWNHRPAEAELAEALRDAVGLLEMHGIDRTDLTPRHAAALSRISKHSNKDR